MIDQNVRAAAQLIAREELARRHLIDFGKLVFPDFKDPRHIRLMAEYLEKVERGEIRRLLVEVSVRHGKSIMCSQVFPAWFLGRNPNLEVVLASYAADLAERNSRVAKNLVESERWPFPNVKIASDSKAVERWNVTSIGGCRAIGVEGGITGRGAHVLVIDDPHATASQSEYARGWKWYQETITPRLNGGARVILVSARFGDLDLAGRILDSEEADQWTVLRIPALCDSADDPLGREIGEALWPEHMSADEIKLRRVAMGPAAWSAQFQQDPVPDGGLIFKSEWFEDNRYDKVPSSRTVYAPHETLDAILLNKPPTREIPLHVIQAADSAWKDGVSNDRSVIVTLASDMKDIFVTDCWFGRLLYPELRARLVEEFTRQKPHPSRLYVEEASSGFALVEDLKRTTAIPIIGVPPGRESKEARAESVTGLFEAGRIKFPRNATWIAEMIAEFLRFPNGKHDDMVDALVLGIRMMRDAMERYRRKSRDPVSLQLTADRSLLVLEKEREGEAAPLVPLVFRVLAGAQQHPADWPEDAGIPE